MVAFSSPALRQQDSDSLQDQQGSEISNTDEQDKMFGYPPVMGYPYYAPNIGYPYVLNPMMNPVCTMRTGLVMPTMPILQQPVYQTPYVPSYPSNVAGYPPNVAAYPPDGAAYPLNVAAYPRNGAAYPPNGVAYPQNVRAHGQPRGGQVGRHSHPKSDSNNQNFGDKVRVRTQPFFYMIKN